MTSHPIPRTSTGCPQARFDLPGLNLPLNWTPHKPYNPGRGIVPAQGDGEMLFPTALDHVMLKNGSCAMPLTTLREFTMLHLMNSLTDKSGWEDKVFDDEIVDKLKAEAMATENADVTQAMVDYVFEELRWRSIELKKTGAVLVYNGDVIKSDSAIPADLKAALRAAVKPLENVPEIFKDYHPGSNEQVLDLVHPSLFPLVYGRSRVLEGRAIGLEDAIENIGKGITVPVPSDADTYLDTKVAALEYSTPSDPPYSRRFQWLPCDVDISNGQANITSYINNLHPDHHRELYPIISQIITKTIPLWNMTLSGIVNDTARDDDTSAPLKRINYSLQFDPDPEDVAEEDRPPQEDDEDEDAYGDRIMEWEDEYRKAMPCDPEKFEPPSDSKPIDLFKDFADHGLQVIVKLANIELTPERPNYPGGSWHVEGQMNEHICATAIYYYDNENISDSYLAFRQQTNTEDADEMNYPQNVHGWLTEIFGVHQDGPAVQDVGDVLCKEDRLLTFPNILQHRVEPFKLADATKTGHRKIVALFLVDPRIRVISTANVPPQQREWWSERVNEDFSGKEAALGKLSNELKEKVFQSVDDFPIGLEEAKQLRLELMVERGGFAVKAAEDFVSTVFSLCEH